MWLVHERLDESNRLGQIDTIPCQSSLLRSASVTNVRQEAFLVDLNIKYLKLLLYILVGNWYNRAFLRSGKEM